VVGNVSTCIQLVRTIRYRQRPASLRPHRANKAVFSEDVRRMLLGKSHPPPNLPIQESTEDVVVNCIHRYGDDLHAKSAQHFDQCLSRGTTLRLT